MLRQLTLVLGALVATLAFTDVAGAAPATGKYIVVLKDGADVGSTVAKHKAKYAAEVTESYKHALKGYAAGVASGRLAELRADPSVAYVAEDEEFELAVDAGCRAFSSEQLRLTQCLPTGPDRIDAERSSTRSGDGRGAVNVNIAVIDSGVDPQQPELNVRGGIDCVDRGKTAIGFGDPFGHGTAVAGFAAAKDNGFGVVGTAPGANIWSARVVPKNQNIPTSNLVCAVDWVTSTRTDADRSNDIAVANMSITGGGADDGNCGRTKRDALHDAICRSTAAGVIYVVAAGNEAVDVALEAPPSYDEVLTAAAMADFDGRPGAQADSDCYGVDQFEMFGDRDDEFAVFSNFATTAADAAHTLAAPGVCVEAPLPVEQCSNPTPPGVPDQCYGHGDGTSFSSPYIAGTVALCIAQRKCTGTPAQIIQKMVADARAYNVANPSYGFLGDPLHSPGPGRHYGYLIRAGIY